MLFTTDTIVLYKSSRGEHVISEAKACIKALKGLIVPDFQRHSMNLYHLLVSPLKKDLKSKTILHIIPDELLRELPFEALVVNENEKQNKSDSYLINRYETIYHATLSGLLRGAKEANDPTGTYSYTNDFTACAPKFSGSEGMAIPYAIRETEKIASLFQSKNRNVCLVSGQGLTLDSLLFLGAQSRVFHLATHGFRSPGSHEFSGWMMPGGQKRIELGSLQAFKMACDLLVLSSCSIGSEAGSTWYRMTGFPENFFQAGVNNILFSLWDVSDEHTAGLMYSFYRNLLDGKSYPEALRAAKLEMISRESTAFPTLWAVFVLWSR